MSEPQKGRRGLGRGLDSLLSASSSGVREVRVGDIEPNPGQPRRVFEAEGLKELAESIRRHGIVQPLVVSRSGPERYRLIVGERRWQASKLAGLTHVPVVEKEASDRQTLELALIENLQRADLNPLEEAGAYQRLMTDFGLTQEEVARQVGKSRAAVANTVRLLTLPEALKAALTEGRISEGHARAILGLSETQQQLAVMEKVERRKLTVRQTEELVRRLATGSPGPPTEPATKSREISALEEDLRRSLGTKVFVHPKARGGRIVIEYYSDDEFAQLYERLLDGV